MKLEAIAIQNFLGLFDLRHRLTSRFLLVAGGNGMGKSSLLDGIRFALSGTVPRGVNARGASRNALITEGAAAGYVEVTVDGFTQRRAIGSGNTTGDALPAILGMDVALDPPRFASMPEDGRRRFLFELMDVKSDRETVVRILRDNEVPDNIIDSVLPMLRGGFDSAVSDSRAKASEARGAWKAITGENYGSQKAATWKPTLDGEAPSRDEIEQAEESVGNARDKVDALTMLAGKVRSALSEERFEALQHEAADESAAQSAFEVAQTALAQATASLNALQSNGADELSCPCCGEPLYLVDGALMMGKGKAAKKPTAAAMRQAEEALQSAKLELDQARGRQMKAAGAKRSLETATTATAEERAQVEGLDEARHVLNLHQQALARLLETQAAADRAAGLEQRAKAEHMRVVGWTTVQGLCEPSGIPAILLARALDPFNAALREQAINAGFAPAQVERDLSLTYAGRAYGLCSESEQWRADALFATVVATVSQGRAIALDRFDVLQPADRGHVLDWLENMIDSDTLNTVVLAGTLKAKPDLGEGIDVLWLSDRAVAQQAAA